MRPGLEFDDVDGDESTPPVAATSTDETDVLTAVPFALQSAPVADDSMAAVYTGILVADWKLVSSRSRCSASRAGHCCTVDCIPLSVCEDYTLVKI